MRFIISFLKNAWIGTLMTFKRFAERKNFEN